MAMFRLVYVTTQMMKLQHFFTHEILTVARFSQTKAKKNVN